MELEERMGLFFWGAVIAGAYGCASRWLWSTDIPEIALPVSAIWHLLKDAGLLMFVSATVGGAVMIGISVTE